MTEQIRVYSTGATRSPLGNKLQYEGYFNPMVMQGFARYMKRHQTDAAGNQRKADNWQQNIPIDDLHDSKMRHDMDAWLHHRGYDYLADEDYETALYGIMFNTMAILKQVMEIRQIEEDKAMNNLFDPCGNADR